MVGSLNGSPQGLKKSQKLNAIFHNLIQILLMQSSQNYFFIYIVAPGKISCVTTGFGHVADDNIGSVGRQGYLCLPCRPLRSLLDPPTMLRVSRVGRILSEEEKMSHLLAGVAWILNRWAHESSSPTITS